MKTHHQRVSLLVLVCSIISLPLLSQTQNEIELIKNNYIHSMTGTDEGKEPFLRLLSSIPPEKEVSDQNVIELQQLYPITQKEIQTLIHSIDTDGSWADIDYNDTKRSGWEPKQHAERILKLTKYYYREKLKENSLQTAELESTIHRAMSYWFTSNLVCKNWWYNQIGIPRTLGPAFLLFEAEMDNAEKQSAIKVMQNSKLGMTGQNKVWLAGNVLIQGLLQNDFELVKDARNTICSEIALGQEEGIKPDWSFHQHGSQQQFGNYGLSFICNMSFYSELLAHTSLAFSTEQQQILTSLFLKGYQWIVWRGYWDVNGLNRQLFHNADIHKSFNLLFAGYSLMKSSTEVDSAAIRGFIDENFLSEKYYKSRRKDKESINSFTGNKYFQNSDMTVHRTPQWMASLRMASNRVIGTELVNEDNLKGYYMADGALYTYWRGDEYHNIFPFWDWRKIPGITSYESDAPLPNANRKDSRNQSSLVGGATDGNQGITAMVLNRNGLTAHKSWIFTDKFVLCLGSNIHSDSTATIVTSIDQRFYKGDVWSYRNERFYHDHTGYILLQTDSCITQTEKKQGQWCDFMGMYKPDLLESNIFSIYLKHGKGKPSSYEYLIIPAISQKEVKRFDTATIRIIRNDEKAQVAIIKDQCFIAAYQEIEIQLNGKTMVKIPQAGTYMIHSDSGKFIVSAPFSTQ